jgi:hypothetical protein
MRYEKPLLVQLGKAIDGVQSPSHTKGINVMMDSNPSDLRPTAGAYEADE